MRPGWGDEFEGPAGAAPDPQRWTAPTGGGHCHAALDGRGRLVLEVTGPGLGVGAGRARPGVAAAILTHEALDLHHGRVAARIRVPAGAGLRAAFWAAAVGADAPASEAVDVMQVLGARTHVVVGGLRGVRRGGPWALTAEGGAPAAGHPSLADGFHEYAATWAPGRIGFVLDGREYGRFTSADLDRGSPWVFDGRFRLGLALTVGGPAGRPEEMTPFPARMLVDWVRVAGVPGAAPGGAATGGTRR